MPTGEHRRNRPGGPEGALAAELREVELLLNFPKARLRVLYRSVSRGDSLPPRATLATIVREIGGHLLLRTLFKREELEKDAWAAKRPMDVFDRWWQGEFERLMDKFREHRAAHGYFVAAENLLHTIQALRLPPDFRGRGKRRRPSALPAGGPLLQEFQDVVRRCRLQVLQAPDRFTALLDTFPDVPRKILAEAHDRPGRFTPARFAKEVLAERYGASTKKIEGALRQGRKNP